jgi:hypothetical protein
MGVYMYCIMKASFDAYLQHKSKMGCTGQISLDVEICYSNEVLGPFRNVILFVTSAVGSDEYELTKTYINIASPNVT